MEESAAKRPVDQAEQALVSAILDGRFPKGSSLPGERDLVEILGVTRPTLREALRRLERDGWITVSQGKSTRVNDVWHDGGLNVLSGIVRHSHTLPDDFVPNLLGVRLDIAPTYTRLGIENAPGRIADLADRGRNLAENAAAFAAFDWTLHRTLTIESGNPVYTLILNGFTDFYQHLAREYYFILPGARQTSRHYYGNLSDAARHGDSDRAADITREVMQASIALWRQALSSITETTS